MEVGVVISGLTTHGFFVSPGLCNPANYFFSFSAASRVALKGTPVYFDIPGYFTSSCFM